MTKTFSEETENNLEEVNSNIENDGYSSVFDEITDDTERVTIAGKKLDTTEYDESEKNDRRFSFKYGTSIEDIYKQIDEKKKENYKSIYEYIEEIDDSSNDEETDQEEIIEEELEEESEEPKINFKNAVSEGAKHAFYNFTNQGSFAKTFASATAERVQPEFIFGKAKGEDVYFTKPYEQKNINTDWDSAIENVSRNLVELAVQMGATAGGAGVGTLVGGPVGTAVGSGAGIVGSSAMVANAMFGESLYDDYNKYLNEGVEDSEAIMRAYHDALVKGSIEFGSNIAFAGVGKLAKLGISSGKLLQAASKLFKSGAITKTEAGYQLSKEGLKTLNGLVKGLVKPLEAAKKPLSTTKNVLAKVGGLGTKETIQSGSKLASIGKGIVKGSAIEGGEEVLQTGWDVGRHRKEGQTWGEALSENKGEIAKAGLMGAVAGGIGITAAHTVGGSVSKLMEYGENKLNQRAENKLAQQQEYEEATRNVLIEQRREEGNPNPENLPAVIDNSNKIKESYGKNIQEDTDTVFVVDEQGNTVIETKSEVRKFTPNINKNESDESQLNIDNNYNENLPNTIYEDDENLNQKIKNENKLYTIRTDLNKDNNLGNLREENAIKGSASDEGYISSDDHSLEGSGFSKKDEAPSTPLTDKLFMEKQNNQTKDSQNKLGFKETEQENVETIPTVDKSTRSVKNNNVSKYHKYYAVKNFVENVGIKIADRANEVFNLYVKGELTNKEKRMQGISKKVMGYVTPAKNNVIRISNSRDYKVILHETFHHLVHQMRLENETLSKNADIIKKEYKNLEKIHPYYSLDEKAYEEKGSDLTEEYFSNLAAAYALDEYTPDKAVIDIINNGLSKVGADSKKNFDIIKQVFTDYNTLKSQKNGALAVTENDMKAARLLSQGKFDTSDLNAEQLKTRKKFANVAKKIPSFIRKHVFDEMYDIEKAAKKVGETSTIKRADQLLRGTNRIAESFIKGSGSYFYNGVLRKLTNKRGIRNLVQIVNDAEKLGKDGLTKLESLLYAKQTIGESTGNQRKGENLIKLANDLGYDNWLNARKDLKLLSTIYKSNLYQNKPITKEDIEIGIELQDVEKLITPEELNSKQESNRTDLLSVNFNDKNLIPRLNKIINYIQDVTTDEINKDGEVEALKIAGVSEAEIKKLLHDRLVEYISDNYLLDKEGSVNTGMTLEDALTIYTSLQEDSRIDEFNKLDNDVRNLLQSLEDLMSSSDVSSRMRIEFAKEDTGAWYIPLLRFIDVNEEKAIGITLGGNSLKKREGSNREIKDIFSSIENSIFAIANEVSRNRAIDKIISLKDVPIFAQYIREVPQNSKEINVSMLSIVNNKLNEIKDTLSESMIKGTLDQKEIDNLNNYVSNLKNIKQQLLNGDIIDDDARVQLFIEEPPTNKNIIQRLEEDGKIHYYLLERTLKDFLYNQRKNFFNVETNNELVNDILFCTDKLLKLGMVLPRLGFTTLSASFQTANISRDSWDSAYKTSKNTLADGLLLPVRFMTTFSKNLEYIGKLATAKNREEFNRLTQIFGGAEQTQIKEGEYQTNILNFKINKNGEIIRGGRFAVIKTMMDILGNTDLIPRVTALQKKAKQLGVDLDTLDMTYDDYVSLNTKKKYLTKYFSNDDIERTLGKEKLNVWLETKDDEYFPYVPENFEKEKLAEIIEPYKEKIDSNINEDLYMELQDVYDNCTINFSKGTPLTRTMGRFFIFANSRIQGGYQTIKFSVNNPKAFIGSYASLFAAGYMAVMLGLTDPTENLQEATSGIRIQATKSTIIESPMQSIITLPYTHGVSVGLMVKDSVKKGMDRLKNTTMSIISDNTAMNSSPMGVAGFLLDAPTLYYTGHASNLFDSEKFHRFNPYYKEKIGVNVDRLMKEQDSVVSYIISNFLVNNGISYKYSAHEISRLLNNVLGNNPQTVEGLLGLKTIFTDRDSHLEWFNYDTSNPIKVLLKNSTKGFLPNEKSYSKELSDIEDIWKNSMSLYKRFTQQPFASIKKMTGPQDLPEDIREKVQVYYDKHYLSANALKLLYTLRDQMNAIDITQPGGQKAYNEAAKIFKLTAIMFKKHLDDYEPEGPKYNKKKQKNYLKQLEEKAKQELDTPNLIEQLFGVGLLSLIPEGDDEDKDKTVSKEKGIFEKAMDLFANDANAMEHYVNKDLTTIKNSTGWIDVRNAAGDFAKNDISNVPSINEREENRKNIENYFNNSGELNEYNKQNPVLINNQILKERASRIINNKVDELFKDIHGITKNNTKLSHNIKKELIKNLTFSDLSKLDTDSESFKNNIKQKITSRYTLSVSNYPGAALVEHNKDDILMTSTKGKYKDNKGEMQERDGVYGIYSYDTEANGGIKSIKPLLDKPGFKQKFNLEENFTLSKLSTKWKEVFSNPKNIRDLTKEYENFVYDDIMSKNPSNKKELYNKYGYDLSNEKIKDVIFAIELQGNNVKSKKRFINLLKDNKLNSNSTIEQQIEHLLLIAGSKFRPEYKSRYNKLSQLYLNKSLF